jgi:hypothetical protein
MVNTKYTAEEALNEIKLRMVYDSSKTLNENKRMINEQVEGDLEYFKTVAKSLMNRPSQIEKVDFGNPTANVKSAAEAIKKSVTNVGTDFHGLDYVLQNGFNSINNTMGIIKAYESTGESLFDALNSEWFAGGTTGKIIDKVATQLTEWCKSNPKVNICIPKSKDELKYGKL